MSNRPHKLLNFKLASHHTAGYKYLKAGIFVIGNGELNDLSSPRVNFLFQELSQIVAASVDITYEQLALLMSNPYILVPRQYKEATLLAKMATRSQTIVLVNRDSAGARYYWRNCDTPRLGPWTLITA